MVKKFFHAVLLFAVLFGTWFVLSGETSPLFIGFGLFSSAFAMLVILRMNVVDSEGHPFHLALTAPFYWLWLFKEMIKSGWGVTKIVWSPTLKIDSEFKWIPTTQTSDLGRTIYANSITLTPGTVCVDMEEKRTYVHALELSSITDLEEGDMDRRVAKLTADSVHVVPEGKA